MGTTGRPQYTTYTSEVNGLYLTCPKGFCMFLGAIVRPLPIIASGHCANLCRLSYPIVAPTTRM